MDDLIAELERTRRRVSAGQLDRAAAHQVELRRTVRAPVSDVWDACTTPERVSRWFLPLSGDLRLGGNFQLEGNAGGSIRRCEPPHRLELTWKFGDAEPSLLALELNAAGGDDTELTLRHTVPDDDHWAQYGPGAVGVGWDITLIGLAAFVSGTAPSDDDGGLMADPRAAMFMRDSAARWGTAHGEVTAQPDAARRAAARTGAAYAPEGDRS